MGLVGRAFLSLCVSITTKRAAVYYYGALPWGSVSPQPTLNGDIPAWTEISENMSQIDHSFHESGSVAQLEE